MKTSSIHIIFDSFFVCHVSAVCSEVRCLETMIYDTVRAGVNRALPVWTVHRKLGSRWKEFSSSLWAQVQTSLRLKAFICHTGTQKTDVCLHLHISVSLDGFMSTSACVCVRAREDTTCFTFPVPVRLPAAMLAAINNSIPMYHTVQCVRM